MTHDFMKMALEDSGLSSEFSDATWLHTLCPAFRTALQDGLAITPHQAAELTVESLNLPHKCVHYIATHLTPVCEVIH